LLTHYIFGDKIEKNEMCKACSLYGEEDRCIQGFSWETCRKDPTWETQV